MCPFVILVRSFSGGSDCSFHAHFHNCFFPLDYFTPLEIVEGEKLELYNKGEKVKENKLIFVLALSRANDGI